MEMKENGLKNGSTFSCKGTPKERIPRIGGALWADDFRVPCSWACGALLRKARENVLIACLSHIFVVARLPITIDENTLLLMNVHHLMQNGVQFSSGCT